MWSSKEEVINFRIAQAGNKIRTVVLVVVVVGVVVVYDFISILGLWLRAAELMHTVVRVVDVVVVLDVVVVCGGLSISCVPDPGT